MIKKLFFSRNKAASFSRRQVFQAMVWAWFLGSVATIAIIISMLPALQSAYTWYQNLGTTHYEGAATSTPALDQETQEKLDRYTDEAYEANQDLFWDYSRGKAIDRMTDELEVEREQLRSNELEGVSFE